MRAQQRCMLNYIIETKLAVSSLFISGACNVSVMGSCGPDYIFFKYYYINFLPAFGRGY